MMLHEDLKDEDIPHRMAVRNHILKIWDEHLDHLTTEMQVCTMLFIFLLYRLTYGNTGVVGEGLVYNGYVV